MKYQRKTESLIWFADFRTFDGLPEACGKARDFARATLGRCSGIVDDAELVVSELFGNAVRHTRSAPDGRVDLAITALTTGLVCLDVVDDGTGDHRSFRPYVRAPAGYALRGRGLFLVDTLVTTWGDVYDEDGRHTVWATLNEPVAASTVLATR